MTTPAIIQAIIALWFVFCVSFMNTNDASVLQKVLWKGLPMVFAFLLGLMAFKVI